MGVICWAAVFFVVSVGTLRMRIRRPHLDRPFRVPGGVAVMGLGVVGAAFFVFLSVRDPYVNADGFPMEWGLLLVWLGLGAVFWIMARDVRGEVDEDERRQLIFGVDAPDVDAPPASPNREPTLATDDTEHSVSP
jgi:amino acid transporter